MLIGYARVSTERQDLAAQLDELRRLGVVDERVYTDKRTGKNKDRPGLREALAARARRRRPAHAGRDVISSKTSASTRQ